jgi:hypothetical protein
LAGTTARDPKKLSTPLQKVTRTLRWVEEYDAPALGTNLASTTLKSKMLQGETLFKEGHMPETCREEDATPVVLKRLTREPLPEASCVERADGNKLVLTPSILRTSREDGR